MLFLKRGACLVLLLLAAGVALLLASTSASAWTGTSIGTSPTGFTISAGPTHSDLRNVGVGSDASNLYFWLGTDLPYATNSAPTSQVTYFHRFYLDNPVRCFDYSISWSTSGTFFGGSFVTRSGCGSVGIVLGTVTGQVYCNEVQVTIPLTWFNTVWSAPAPTAGTPLINGHPGGSGTSADAAAAIWPLYTYSPATRDHLFEKGTYSMGSTFEKFQPPPSSVSVSATGDNEATVSWTAPTGSAQPAQKYKVYRDNTYVGETTGTSYVDTGLASGTAYSYQVSSVNCMGEGAKSNGVSITPDFKPGTPTLSSGAVTYDSAALSWSAPSDMPATGASGIGGYQLYRSTDATVDTSDTLLSVPAGGGTLSFTDTGLGSSTTYWYAVRAYDQKAGTANVGGFSNTVLITTPAPPDLTKPTVPTGLQVVTVTSTTLELAWTPSTDTSGIASYDVFCAQGATATPQSPKVGSVPAASPAPPSVSFTVTQLQPDTTYACIVRAIDVPGNTGDPSSVVQAKTLLPPDVTPPSAPSLSLVDVDLSWAKLSWTTATDDTAVVGYQLWRSTVAPQPSAAALVASLAPNACTPACQVQDVGLSVSTTYRYTAQAIDAAGNAGVSNDVLATTPTPVDTSPPSASQLTATPLSPTVVKLDWSAAVDNVGVVSYHLERDGALLQTLGAGACAGGPCAWSDTNAVPGATYKDRVRAEDAAGNLGAFSAPKTVTTPLPPDTTPPAAPVLAGAALGHDRVALGWTKPSDVGTGVVSYRLFRAIALPVPLTTPIHQFMVQQAEHLDLSVAPGQTYHYVLQAVDGAGNVGPASNVVTATTPGAPIPKLTAVLLPAVLYAVQEVPVEFVPTVTGGAPPWTCAWSTDSPNATGSASGCGPLSIQFASAGEHLVRLDVSSSDGQHAVLHATVYVQGPPPELGAGVQVLDVDRDGVPDAGDNCAGLGNAAQVDRDGDDRGDACDGSPGPGHVSVPPQGPRVLQGAGTAPTAQAAPSDRDGDGLLDGQDDCPDVPGSGIGDADADGQGDACDLDLDGDQVPNDRDTCPRAFNPDQLDADGDLRGAACDGMDDASANASAGAQPDAPADAKPSARPQQEPGNGIGRHLLVGAVVLAVAAVAGVVVQLWRRPS